MKTFRKIMMAMFVMALVGMATSCSKDNKDNEGDSYSAKLVGTWQVDRVSFNGQDVTAMMANVQLSFNANGTGLLNDGGETENNDFQWVINGNDITVTTHHDQFTFTITSLTNTECTFTGTSMEMDGNELTGTIEIHMTKVNGGGDQPGPGPALESLEGTAWAYQFHMDTTEQGFTVQVEVNLTLNFTSATAGVAGETGYMKMMQNGEVVHEENMNENAPFSYTYNASSKTGVITGTVYDEESGEEETTTMNITYNSSNNTLIVVLPDYDPEEQYMPQTMVFQRVRK